jgi:hypothetical protein
MKRFVFVFLWERRLSSAKAGDPRRDASGWGYLKTEFRNKT